jgi:hypothetical protein
MLDPWFESRYYHYAVVDELVKVTILSRWIFEGSNPFYGNKNKIVVESEK